MSKLQEVFPTDGEGLKLKKLPNLKLFARLNVRPQAKFREHVITSNSGDVFPVQVENVSAGRAWAMVFLCSFLALLLLGAKSAIVGTE